MFYIIKQSPNKVTIQTYEATAFLFYILQYAHIN